ncbi:transcriptional regulator [Leptospirillum ferrooxidans]|nr:Cro/CI family transcriptional regulator [Leptospirillum ferrooxidans]
MKTLSSVQEIISYFGNQSEMARRLSISPQAIQRWVSTNHLPVRRAIQIERLTEGKILFNEIIHLTGIGEVAEITTPIVPEPISTKPPEMSGVAEDRRGVLRRNSDKGRRENPRQSGNK